MPLTNIGHGIILVYIGLATRYCNEAKRLLKRKAKLKKLFGRYDNA